MSDLKKYIKKRIASDKAFANGYKEGYEDFKISAILRALREKAGLTQEELAGKMHTQKSAISRMENKSEDIRISTLFKFAAVLGKNVHITIN
jgi:HTH-type transcriptional regulator / antitoxin HipB